MYELANLKYSLISIHVYLSLCTESFIPLYSSVQMDITICIYTKLETEFLNVISFSMT